MFFAFTNAAPPLYLKDNDFQLLYGFSVALKGVEDERAFDDVFGTEFPALQRKAVLNWTPDATEIKGIAVGDKSVGVAAKTTVNGFIWSRHAVSFRVEAVGAFVFTLYPAPMAAPNNIAQIAQLYARHLAP